MQAKRIQAELFSNDIANRLNQRTAALRAQLHAATTANTTAFTFMRAHGKKVLAGSGALYKSLEEAQRKLAASSYESILEEAIHKMNEAVEKGLAGLKQKTKGKKRKEAPAAGQKAAAGNTTKRARKVSFSTF